VKYLLDTDICIYLIRNKPPQVLRHFQDIEPGDVGISSITLAELSYGVAKSARAQQNAEALEAFVLPLEICPFDETAAQAYGGIRAGLEGRGRPIGSLDTLIAAQTLSMGLTLVTNNEREFGRVPGLKLENWTRDA